ncbi:TPA: outer membrane beta-barrel protein [Salmonella enterica subsp. enterica serovar Kottbus]
MKHNIALLLALSAMTAAEAAPVGVYRQTLSAGPAVTHFSGGGLQGNAWGVSTRYQGEISGTPLGAAGAFTHTQRDISGMKGKVSYNSLMAGPSYRFNDHVSARVMAGTSRTAVDTDDRNHSRTVTALAFGAGVQVNLTRSWVLEMSYEHSRYSAERLGAGLRGKQNAGTWVLGGGYRF